MVKNLPANAENMRYVFDPWVGKILWRRAQQPTPVFLPGESHGQMSLAGYTVHRVSRVRHDLATKPLPPAHFTLMASSLHYRG